MLLGIPDEEISQLVELQGVYDGWSVLVKKDGTMVNRWEPDDYRYRKTQDWIEMQKEK